jgi:hypothetical protein
VLAVRAEPASSPNNRPFRHDLDAHKRPLDIRSNRGRRPNILSRQQNQDRDALRAAAAEAFPIGDRHIPSAGFLNRGLDLRLI